jgi:hypothetical protein
MSRFNMETTMKKLILTVALLAACQPAFAGGPVIVEDAYEAEATRPGALVPIIVGVLILCAIACGSDGPDVKPGPVCNSGC